MHHKKMIVYSLALMMLVDAIGIGLVFPILPELFLNHKTGLALEGSFMLFSREEAYSICLAVFPLGSMLGMPILGDISDKIGRRKVLLFGLGCLALNYLCCAGLIFIHKVRLFILARFAAGFLSGTYSVAGAMISDLSATPEERIANFKLPLLGSLVGIIVGPSLSIFIYHIEFMNPLALPFMIAFILAAMNFILLFYFTSKLDLTQGNNKHIDIPVSDVLKHSFSNIKIIFQHLRQMLFQGTTKHLAFTYFLFQFAFATFLQSLALYLEIDHHFTSFDIGRFFIVMSIAMIIGMYGLHKLIQRYISDIIQVQIGLITMIIIFFIQTILEIYHIDVIYLKHLYLIWIASVTFYMILPLVTLNFTNIFSISGSSMEQGQIMGAMGLLYSIAWFISGISIGPLMKAHYDLILVIATLSIFASYVIFYFHINKSD